MRPFLVPMLFASIVPVLLTTPFMAAEAPLAVRMATPPSARISPLFSTSVAMVEAFTSTDSRPSPLKSSCTSVPAASAVLPVMVPLLETTGEISATVLPLTLPSLLMLPPLPVKR